jgi:hypothetical protein
VPYRVRKNRLFFEPNTGNGPCNRRLSGQAFRRVVPIDEVMAVHVTKGRLHRRDEISDPRANRRGLPAPIFTDAQMIAAQERAAHRQAQSWHNRPRASIPGGVRRRQAKV